MCYNSDKICLFLVLLLKCQCCFRVSRRDRHHRSDDPADVDGVRSVLHVHLWVFQGILGVVQDFKTDVHHTVLKLSERVTGRWSRNTREEQRKETVGR